MCDYSLEHVQSRPAAVGDKLVIAVFPNSITRGFAAVDGPQAEYGGVLRHTEAVCLRPGTELVFEENVKYDHMLGEHTTARFREINPHHPHQHHDSLEFPDGHGYCPVKRLQFSSCLSLWQVTLRLKHQLKQNLHLRNSLLRHLPNQL